MTHICQRGLNINPPHINNQRENLSVSNNTVKMTHNPAFGAKALPVYAITGDRKLIPFDSVYEVSDKLGISLSTINNCLQGRLKTAGGFVFRREDAIKDKAGRLCPKKITKHAKNLNTLCVIDNQLGVYTPINPKDAENIVGIPYNKIRSHYIRKTLTKNDKVIVARADIEDEYGNLDINKVQALSKEVRGNRYGEGFYAVDRQYRPVLWQRGAFFAKHFNVARTNVYQCLSGHLKTVKGYALLSRSLVEDKTGKIVIKKLRAEANKKFYDRKTHPLDGKNKILALHPSGEIKSFRTLNDASAYTKRGHSLIADSLKGRRKPEPDNWFYTYLYRFRDENGIVDNQKVKEFLLSIFTGKNQK